MSDIPEIVTGDSIAIAVVLKRNGATFTINPAAVVKAALVSVDHKTMYMTAAVIQSNAAPGADWANSLVVIEFAPADTSAITYQGKAIIEIQVAENNKPKTWFVSAKIITGNIP